MSQRYLGYPGLVEGGPADFLILDEDPRANPTILANPARVTLGGNARVGAFCPPELAAVIEFNRFERHGARP